MSFQENLKKILDRRDELAHYLATGQVNEEYARYSKEYTQLADITTKIELYNSVIAELEGTKELLEDTSTEPIMKDAAQEEAIYLNKKLIELERNIKTALLPKDDADKKNVILEVRAGTGGEEAALFAADLFCMYHKYATSRNWHFEILSLSEIGIGGYKEASGLISGHGAFARLKFESGVHRVQRIPRTESNGRIHTSAATVAVLPEAEEIDVHIDAKDIRIDTYRSSGAGGQHVNTTDSAVRITHLPTGIVVTQSEKSQHKNKATAMKILLSRIYEMELKKKALERASARKSQVGSGDRSERIRTYNYPQGRVSDHRINLTLYKIDEIVKEGKLDDFIDNLMADDEAKRLSEELF